MHSSNFACHFSLKLSNIWYGHAFSVCWMQSELPKDFPGADYETSGWCFVEAAISALVKLGLNRLDLRRRTESDGDGQVELLPIRHADGCGMLGGVAHDR